MIVDDPSYRRWKAEADAAVVERDAAREAERQERERQRREANRATAEGWVAYFEKRLADEHEHFVELLEQAFAAVAGDLRAEFTEELSRAIRLAFLERGGWMPRVCGTYDEARSYSALDIVTKDGTAWLAKHSDPGPCPGEGWQILSCKGSRGPIGPSGPRGEVGPQGPRGESGVKIASWRVDAKRYQVFPVMSDGHLGVPLDLNEIFDVFRREIGELPRLPTSKTDRRLPGHSAPIISVASGPPEQANGGEESA